MIIEAHEIRRINKNKDIANERGNIYGAPNYHQAYSVRKWDNAELYTNLLLS